jgi:micrococcal nuclease
MTQYSGTHITVPFSKVVDGDTIKVELPNSGVESIRILCLDTEEKPGSSGSKPKTPWGEAATVRAIEFFTGANEVTLEFPGKENVETCLQKYRGNYGRVLAFVYRDGVDFQQTMIREGYSAYFSKYGYASLTANHLRYAQAEREAQMAHVGVWNQQEVNGQIRRDYPLLSTWWTLRAETIERYRSQLASGKTLYNTRLDYSEIMAKAQQGLTVTLFTEVRNLRTIHNDATGFIDIGSQTQRFTLFLPSLNSEQGTKIRNLLEHRYISTGDDSNQPRRSYLYVTGQLSLYNNDPQMVVTHVDQISDGFGDSTATPPPATANPRIVAILPNPAGHDAGNETVTLKNPGTSEVSLQGWKLVDRSGNSMILDGMTLAAESSNEITVKGSLSLNNTGDDVILFDQNGEEVDKISYDANQAISGQPIFF